MALVGLMGAGKSAVGQRLAMRLACPSSTPTAKSSAPPAARIAEFFERYGEAAFRDGERRSSPGCSTGPPHVLSTGGGAFIDPETRELIERAGAVGVAEGRPRRAVRPGDEADNRPLLQTAIRKEMLAGLMIERYPIYAEADITVDFDAHSPPNVPPTRSSSATALCRGTSRHGPDATS